MSILATTILSLLLLAMLMIGAGVPSSAGYNQSGRVPAPLASEPRDPFAVLKETLVYDIVSTPGSSPLKQREPSLGINPTKPGPAYNIIVSFNDKGTGSLGVGIAYSTDGGDTFTTNAMPGPPGRTVCCDSVVAFQSDGTAYVIGQTNEGDEFIIQSTEDGGGNAGATWGAPVTIVSNVADRPWLAVDNGVNRGCTFDSSGPTGCPGGVMPTDYIYVAWQRSDEGNCEYISRSTGDGAAGTWAAPVKLCNLAGATTGFRQDTVIGPSGEVYVVWQGNNGLDVVCKSSGWPAFTCTNPATLGWSSFPNAPPACASARPTVPNTCYRTNSQPKLAVDLSNNMYLVWQNFGPGSTTATGDGDVLMSTANGVDITTWTAPVQINDDSAPGVNDGVDQFFPDIAFDPLSGNILAVFYDRRDVASDTNFYFYYALSTDGGSTFPTQNPISSVSSNPAVSSDTKGLGDYQGADVVAVPGSSGVFAAVWTDLRDGSTFPADQNSNIYFALLGNTFRLPPLGCLVARWCLVPLIPSIEAFPCGVQFRFIACPPPEPPCEPPYCPYLISVEGRRDGELVTITPRNLPQGVLAVTEPSHGITPFTAILHLSSEGGLKAGTYWFDLYAQDADGVNTTVRVPLVIATSAFVRLSQRFADPQQSLTLIGVGFQPSTIVRVTLDQFFLFNATASPLGNVFASFKVPAIAAGVHTLMVSDDKGNTATAALITPQPITENDEKLATPPILNLPYLTILAALVVVLTVFTVAILLARKKRKG